MRLMFAKALAAAGLLVASSLVVADNSGEVLEAIMTETAGYSAGTLSRLSASQRADFDAGVPVVISGQIKDMQGRTLPEGKRADTYVLVDLPPAVTFAVLTDLKNYSTIFADVSRSEVLKSETVGSEKQALYLQIVDLPAITDPVSYMLIHSRSDDTNADGTPDAYAIWWHRDDSVVVKDSDGDPIAPNLTVNSGAWKILPWADGSKSLVFYTLIQVPGFSVPNFAWEKATTYLGIPKVIQEVTRAGKSGRYKG